jgi:hypothetical protein
MSLMRAGAWIDPRGDDTATTSPSDTPSDSASAGESSTQASGAASCSSGARPVFVRVWKWKMVLPVLSRKRWSPPGSSCGGR